MKKYILGLAVLTLGVSQIGSAQLLECTATNDKDGKAIRLTANDDSGIIEMIPGPAVPMQLWEMLKFEAGRETLQVTGTYNVTSTPITETIQITGTRQAQSGRIVYDSKIVATELSGTMGEIVPVVETYTGTCSGNLSVPTE